MTKKKTTKYRNAANPERNRAMVEKRRSGAAGFHLDKRERRSRTRDAAMKKAMKDYQ